MIPDRGQDLSDGLLDHAIQHGRNSEKANPASGFSDLLLPYGHGFEVSFKQCLLNLGPMSFQVPLYFADGHAVHPRGALVLDYTPDSASHVVPLKD